MSYRHIINTKLSGSRLSRLSAVTGELSELFQASRIVGGVACQQNGMKRNKLAVCCSLKMSAVKESDVKGISCQEVS
jgi:hypothetical protein